MNHLHRVLVAAGLAGIYEQMATGPFAIVAAPNKKRIEDLKVLTREMGYGFISPAVGIWRNPKTKEVEPPEPSLFIPGITREDAIELGRQLQQNEVLWGDGGKFEMVKVETGATRTSGDVEERFHHLDPGEVPEEGGMTKIKKRWPFEFRESSFEAVGNVDAVFGGWALGDSQRSFPGFNDTVRLDADGDPYFFWRESDMRMPFPRFGFGVEERTKQALSETKGFICRAGSKTRTAVGGLAVYIPLKRAKTVKEKWGRRRGKAESIWTGIIAGPARQAGGGEEIVDKFWVTDEGKLIHHGRYETHQEWAMKFLRQEGMEFKGSHNENLLQAEIILLDRGWIRGQVYPMAGLGLHGKEDAINNRGHVALQLVPKPKRVYIIRYPETERTVYFPESYEEVGLGKAAAMEKTAWGDLAEVNQGTDFANRMGGTRAERATRINQHLRTVVRSESFRKTATNPKPKLTDAIINAAIAHAQELLGKVPGRLDSLIIDPRGS